MKDNLGNFRISTLRNNYAKMDDEIQRKSVQSSFSKYARPATAKKSVQNNDDKIFLRTESYSKTAKYNKRSSKRNVVEFDDVKWLSIVSVYAPQNLQFVTASRSSYKKFLNNKDIVHDFKHRNEFKVII